MQECVDYTSDVINDDVSFRHCSGNKGEPISPKFYISFVRY